MENKKIVPIWLSLILLVLLVGGIVSSVITSISFKYVNVSRVLDIIACVLALVYCLKGYSKNAAGYFKVFCIVYCVSWIFPILVLAPYFAEGGTFTLNTSMSLLLLGFGCLSVFVVANDLGRKKSYVMSWIILVSQLVSFALLLINNSDITFFVMGTIGKVILAIVFLIMVYAKYQDKEARGTK